MKHLGDITKICGAEIEPVDCITFGSPCQDLSVAGKRKGLAGKRSGLFMEAVRIIKEMRANDEAIGRTAKLIRPRFAIWENVPGAFSSNNGEDFRAVLEELARIKQPDTTIPEPEKRHTKRGEVLVWQKAGAIRGDGWELAWRTFDAQYWGVPQRRKRIALVVDFAGGCAGEILFERTGVRGDFAPGIKPWKGIARNPQQCAAPDDGVVENEECLTPWDVQSRRIFDETGKWPAIYSGDGGGHGYVMQNVPDTDCENVTVSAAFCPEESAKTRGVGYAEEQSPTLRAGAVPGVVQKTDICIPINTMVATRWKHVIGVQHLESEKNGEPQFTLGTAHEHAVCFGIEDTHCYDMTHANDVIRDCGELAPNLQARMGTGGNQVPIVPICMNMRTGEDIANALKARDYKGVGCEDSLGSVVAQAKFSCDDVARTLKAKANCQYREDSETYICEQLGCATFDCRSYKMQAVSGTLQAKENGGQSLNYINPVLVKTVRWIVRRLTPTECERLQGYPDGWTLIGEWTDSNGKHHKLADSPRYKALGNSIALPQWWWIACKMASHLPQAATLGSLFDGIGGFPLVWETRYGAGTARWASEIEEFPIAVTKARFPEAGQGNT